MTDSSPGGDNIDRRIWFIRGDRHAVRSPARGKEGLRTESDRPHSDLTEPLRLEMPERLCTCTQLRVSPHTPKTSETSAAPPSTIDVSWLDSTEPESQ